MITGIHIIKFKLMGKRFLQFTKVRKHFFTANKKKLNIIGSAIKRGSHFDELLIGRCWSIELNKNKISNMESNRICHQDASPKQN